VKQIVFVCKFLFVDYSSRSHSWKRKSKRYIR